MRPFCDLQGKSAAGGNDLLAKCNMEASKGEGYRRPLCHRIAKRGGKAEKRSGKERVATGNERFYGKRAYEMLHVGRMGPNVKHE